MIELYKEQEKYNAIVYHSYNYPPIYLLFSFPYCPSTYILRQYNTDTSLILSYYLGTAYYLITWYLLYHVIT